jgi:hypothetical protein
MRAALLQRADDLQEFLLERVPQLLSFDSVEALRAKELGLTGDSQILVYVIADLSDHLASGILIDLARLASHVCRQLGQQASVTGLLYLPNSTSPAPAEEAVAYAALKELEHYATGHSLNGSSAFVDGLSQSSVPFGHGCYLLDDVTETGYTLRDPRQLVLAACEYLYAMTFHNMASVVHHNTKRRYRRGTLRGKARSYESFGMATRYIPRQLLARWTEAHLGSQMLGAVLGGETSIDPEHQARTFVDQMGLGIQALETTLRKTNVAARIDQGLRTLRQSSVGQIETRAREVLYTIRQQHLPLLNQEVTQASQTVRRQVQTALVEHVETSMQDLPVGSISLQRAFLGQLGAQVNELLAQLQARVKQQQRELARSLGTVSETYYALRNVAMGTPPWPAILLGVLGVLLLPLLYISFFLTRLFHTQSPGTLLTLLGILGGGTLGVISLVLIRLFRQRRMLCERHIAMVRQRAIVESRPAVYREIEAIYGALLETIAQAESELAVLAEQLAGAQARCQERRSKCLEDLLVLTKPGPFQSVVDREGAEAFYARAVPNLNRSTTHLMQQAGPLSYWLARSAELGDQFAPWVDEQIASMCALHLDKSVRRYTIAEALTHRQADVERLTQGLLESAQPLWNVDPHILGRATTQRMTFVGVDASSPAWTDVSRPLAQACPSAIVHNTDDSSTLTVVNVHLGMPLYALRRIDQYRTHYAEMLWRGKLPVHTTGKLALAGDLIPIRRLKTQAPVLFAVGLALGVVQREHNGRYVAPRGRNQTIRLSTQKERAVALMGMDASTCREIERRLDRLLAQEGSAALHARLDDYTASVSDLADWEIDSIIRFSRSVAETQPQA